MNLEYAIRKVQENRGEQESNGTHQLLGENINTIRKKTQNLCYRLVGRLV
jgi:hypothetical protein